MHCAIVCTQSPVFTAAVDGKFKVCIINCLKKTLIRSSQEAFSRDIKLSDDGLAVVRALVKYLYTEDYDDTYTISDFMAAQNLYSGNSSPSKAETNAPLMVEGFTPEPRQEDFFDDLGSSVFQETPAGVETVDQKPTVTPLSLLFNVQMYVVGDKYDIPALKTLAYAKYKGMVNRYWNTAVFTKSVDLMLENTVNSDTLLRKVIFRTIKVNLRVLLKRVDFMNLLKKHGELALELLLFSVDSPNGSWDLEDDELVNFPTKQKKKGKNYPCPSCGRKE